MRPSYLSNTEHSPCRPEHYGWTLVALTHQPELITKTNTLGEVLCCVLAFCRTGFSVDEIMTPSDARNLHQHLSFLRELQFVQQQRRTVDIPIEPVIMAKPSQTEQSYAAIAWLTQHGLIEMFAQLPAAVAITDAGKGLLAALEHPNPNKSH